MKKALIVSALVAWMVAPALAQPADGETAATAKAAQKWTPTWSSPAIADAAGMLTGVWKTSSQVAQADGAASTNIVMAVAPIHVEGLPDALYVEAAREDSLFEPYRQAIFQFYAYKGGIRLRTYEFRTVQQGVKSALVGLVYAPDAMWTIGGSDLLATLDIDLTKSGDGFTGKTPYPYPTGVAGAVEMTSEITLSPAKLVSVDRGIAADGSVAWGSKPGDTYTFAKIESPVVVTRTPEGVVWVTLRQGEGEPIKSGQLATAHYTGMLDDGRIFDSSRPRAQPMTFRWPGQMVAGWNAGITGLKVGERRRLVIPSDQGYEIGRAHV